jgi:hypothetical protein
MPVPVAVLDQPFRVVPVFVRTYGVGGVKEVRPGYFKVGATNDGIGSSTTFLELSTQEFKTENEAFGAMLDGLEIPDSGQSSQSDLVVEALVAARLVDIRRKG